MHRQIMGVTDPKQLVDHRDRRGLNNCKSNLRICTPSQNQANCAVRKNSSSQYLGVCRRITKHRLLSGEVKEYKKWVSTIRKDGKNHFIVQFPFTEEGEILAAKAYDKKAAELHGEFARLNFPDLIASQ